MQTPTQGLPTTTSTTAAGESTSTAAGAVISPGAAGEPELVSAAFDDGGPIPVNHTCEGADVSPALSWSGIPTGTVEVAITVTDTDAGGFVHWVIANLDPTRSGLDAGEVPTGAVAATNGFGLPAYSGPCPPGGTHHYVFTLYALAAPSGVTQGLAGAEAIARLDSVARTAEVTLTGTYSRQ